jgi:transposase
MLRLEPLILDQPSRALYDRFVPPDHPLRRFDEALDFAFVLPLVAARYHDEIGRPAEHPERLFRLLFAQFYLNLPDEKVCLAAHESLALRLFLRLGADETPPHPTTLQKFRAHRLDVDVYLTVHFELLRQAEAHGLLSRQERQIFDTSHVRSNTRVVSLARLLLEARGNVVREVKKIDAAYGATLEAAMADDRAAYRDEREKRRADGKPKLTKDEKIRAAIERVTKTLDEVRERIANKHLEPTERLNVALEILAKVIADREKGAEERIVSVHDAEARKGKKTTVTWDGRKLAVNVTDESYFITAACCAPGNDNDCELLIPLLDQQQKHFDLVPPELTADKAADLDPLRERIAARGILAHVPVAPAPNAKGVDLFRADDFVYDPEEQTLTCPANKVARNPKRDKAQSRDGYGFKFPLKTCRECPLNARCQPPASPTTKRHEGRAVTISVHWKTAQAAKKHAQTERFKSAYRRRGRIEPKIWELTYHGQRRCRYRGDERSQMQLLLTVTVVNGKRLVRLLHQRAHPPRPRRRGHLL